MSSNPMRPPTPAARVNPPAVPRMDSNPASDANQLLVVEEAAVQPEDIPGEKKGDISVEEDSDIVLDEDMWNWKEKGLSCFLDWVTTRLQSIPPHNGKDTTGLERAISYFEKINKEISCAMREDFKNQIDTAKAESMRSEIEDGLDKLISRLTKVKAAKFKRYRKSSAEEGLVKEAAQSTAIHGIIVTVPLLISRIARVCINGQVASGHSIEDSFWRLAEKYELTKRERAELEQLLADMGYWVRRDRGFLLDEEILPSSTDKFDWQANYPA